MKFSAVWILNVLADRTRRTENQKLWAKTLACGASSCAHPRTRAILRNTHLSGGWICPIPSKRAQCAGPKFPSDTTRTFTLSPKVIIWGFFWAGVVILTPPPFLFRRNK